MFFLERFEQSIEATAQQQSFVLPITIRGEAREFHARFDGLIQTWLLDERTCELVMTGQSEKAINFNGLEFT